MASRISIADRSTMILAALLAASPALAQARRDGPVPAPAEAVKGNPIPKGLIAPGHGGVAGTGLGGTTGGPIGGASGTGNSVSGPPGQGVDEGGMPKKRTSP